MSKVMGASRREFCVGGVSTLALIAGLGSGKAMADASHPKATDAPTADEAMKRLLEGNANFAAGTLTQPGRTPAEFRQLAAAQFPIVAILGCSDSRVPPEILFDQPIGSIFTVRVAGNYVNGAGAAVTGSLEYAVEDLKVPLVVVLGHSGCGAVKAAIADIHGVDPLPGSIHDLVNSIKPAVMDAERKHKDPLEEAVRSNVIFGTQRLKTLQPILGPRVKAGTLKVVGMTYNLESGRVVVLD